MTKENYPGPWLMVDGDWNPFSDRRRNSEQSGMLFHLQFFRIKQKENVYNCSGNRKKTKNVFKDHPMATMKAARWHKDADEEVEVPKWPTTSSKVAVKFTGRLKMDLHEY